MLDFTENAGLLGAIAAPITSMFRENEKGNTPEDQKRLDIASKIDETIKKYGGIDKLKIAAKTNRSLAMQMGELLKEAANADANIVTSIDFAEPKKALASVGAALKNSSIKNYIEDKKNINITTESSKAKLIGMLPQQTRDMEGNITSSGVGNFDPKSGMTIEQGTDYYDIIQDRGTKTDSKGGTITVPPAKIRVYKNEAAYKYIEANTEKPGYKLDVRGLDDTFRVKSRVVPEFYSIGNDQELIKETIGKYNDHVNNEVKTAITNVVGAPPTIFLSKETTGAYMRQMYRGKIEPEKIDKLLDRIEANFSKYKVELLPNRSKQCWSVRFKSPYAASPYTSNINDNPELNSDFAYVLKNMPQMIIMPEVIKILNRDVKNIDKI
jgi:hypothetical protein